jgi:hypothetical protein
MNAQGGLYVDHNVAHAGGVLSCVSSKGGPYGSDTW